MSLSSLLKKSTIDDHEAVLAACGNDTSSDALQAKAIALLKLDQYAEALTHFEKNAQLKQNAPEAYAYCLYKNGKFEEAAKSVENVGNSRGAQHIAIQSAYRSEDWSTANQSYKSVSETSFADETFDLRVNKLALDAQGIWLGQIPPASVPRATTDDLSTFETAFNSACIAVAKGQLAEADVLLKRAINLCEHHEDLGTEEKAVELVPLKAQRLFVLQCLQKHDESQILAKEVEGMLAHVGIDAATRKIAQNNVLTVSSSQSNPYIVHKSLSAVTIPTEDRLFSYQSIPLASNDKTIDLQTFKFDGLIHGAKKSMSKMDVPNLSSNSLLASFFEAAARARNEVGKAAINRVLPELEKCPNDVGLIVTLVHMYLTTGNVTAAVSLMESFFKNLEASTSRQEQDLRFAPSLITIMVGLYRKQGRRSHVKQELAKAATYWRTKSKAPVTLLQAAGVALLSSTDTEDAKVASEIFDKLYEQQPNDRAIIAGYVASHSSEAPKVQPLSNKLTEVSKLTSGIDVDSLEKAGVPQSANALAIAQASKSRKRTATDSLTSKKPKRIRKSRLPKNYDPNAKPDPERWLPLKDRSSYRPAKGKKKAKKDDRTQGGGNVNESLDITNRPAGGSEVVTGGAGGGGSKKKKGKGKK